MEVTVFSHEKCDLGEGPLWFPERRALFWVDINRHLVFEKTLESNATHYDTCWEFTETPTALVRVHKSPHHLWIVTASGLIKLNLVTGEQSVAVNYSLQDELRTNDAGVGPDGQLWIGTMQRVPTSPMGRVFSINNDGDITWQAEQITIPNTFCWSPEGTHCYLTDSFEQVVYRAPFPSEIFDFKQHPWQRSQCPAITFDGGAIDQCGNLWVARWGGGCVEQFAPAGQRLFQQILPVQQPSSCCFGGDDNHLLFVTSAMEGLTSRQKEASTDAGKVFVMKCQVAGSEVPAFHMNAPK